MIEQLQTVMPVFSELIESNTFDGILDNYLNGISITLFTFLGATLGGWLRDYMYNPFTKESPVSLIQAQLIGATTGLITSSLALVIIPNIISAIK